VGENITRGMVLTRLSAVILGLGLIGQYEVCLRRPLRDAGDPPPVGPSATGDRRRAQADRCGRDDLPQPPTTGQYRTTGIAGEWGVDAPPARQPVPVALGSYLPHSSGKAARPPPPCSLQRPHDERSASGGHL
jgi:hypothetical protein